MRAVLRVVAVLTAGLVVAAGGTAASAKPVQTGNGKTLPSTTYRDKKNGYQITVPTKWRVVPPHAPTVKKMATQLKQQKQTKLANFYLSFTNTANGKAELKSFMFRAFLWPPLPSPVPTDVSVRWDSIAARFKQKDLAAIGATFAKQLKTPGTNVSQARIVKYPAGNAAVITGVAPLPKAYGGAKSAFTVVLFLRPGKLYTISYRIDSRAAKDAYVFKSITEHFRFLKTQPGAA